MTLANVLIIIAGALIASRLTRLAVADQITQPARDKVLERRGADHWLTYFVHCPWCVGVWLGVAAALAVWFTAPDSWPITAWWGVTGLAALYSWINGLTTYTIGAE